MTRNIKIGSLDCLCCPGSEDRIAYILYPTDMLADWIEPAVNRYGPTIVVITGMDWQNVFSPWPAKGVPACSSDFKGESPQFLATLQQSVIPQVERALNISPDAERTLVGVSMSGLFALWQWMLCDTFANIASLSGSFWYAGFLDWMRQRAIPEKLGRGFFLLGNLEDKSKVKVFDCVAANTEEILNLLREADVDVEFRSVPGNHYSNPIPRLELAFQALYE